MTQAPAPRRTALVLVFLFGLLPYVSTIKWPPIPSFWAEWMAAILAAAVAIWLSPRRTGPALPALIPLASLACLAGAFIVAAQLIARVPQFQGPALLAAAELVLAAIVCASAARLCARGPISRELEAMAFGLLVAVFFNALAVLAERNGWQVYLYQFIPRDPPDRALGLFGQFNQLAVFSAMAWCAAQYLWMQSRIGGWLLIGVAALVGAIDAGTASRAGAIVFIAATVLGWLALHQHTRRQAGRRLLIGGVVMFVAMQWWWALTTSSDVAVTTVMRSDTALRIELLRDALALATRHPFAGVGFGNFSAARWEELAWPMGEPVSAHAHNVVAQLAAELGILGALLVVLPAAFVVLKSLRPLVSLRARPEQFFVAGVLVVVSGYSLTEYPLWYAFFLFPFAFLLGMVDQPCVSFKPLQTQYMNVLRRGTWALAFAGAIALAWDYRRTETLYVDATIQQQSATSGAQMTLDLPTSQIRRISLLTVFDRHADLMLARTLAVNGRLMADKLPITERVMLAFPTWENVFRHIAFLVAAGKPDEARAVWAKTERNAAMRKDTYEALQRQAPNVSGLPAFLATLPNPPVPPVPPKPH
jgi:O-antigen ligase